MHPFPGGVQMPQLGLQQVSPVGQMLLPDLTGRGGGLLGMQTAALFLMMQRWPEMQSTRAQSGFCRGWWVLRRRGGGEGEGGLIGALLLFLVMMMALMTSESDVEKE